MRQFLELSSFYLPILSLFFCASGAMARIQTVVPTASKRETLNLDFLIQAEDIEREAWWVVTTRRIDGAASPFRVFRAAAATLQKKQKSKMSFKFCKSLLVVAQGNGSWRIESSCQNPSTEIGIVQKLKSRPDKWKISWKLSPFSDHFGMSTSILYTQQTCEIDLDLKGRIKVMSCPHYVRDRKLSEIVDFKIFEYTAQAPQLLKLEGEIKKDLQVISTFKTEVPLAGDIVLKVKNVAQKPVEEKTELSNINQPVPTRGESHGQKSEPQAGEKSNEKDDEKDKIKNFDENREAKRLYEKSRAEEESYSENGDEKNYDKNSYEGQNSENEEAGSSDDVPATSVPPIAPPSR